MGDTVTERGMTGENEAREEAALWSGKEAGLRLGAHLSISGGPDKTVELARAVHASTFQFFTRNPRGGARRTISEEEAIRWGQVRRENDLFPIIGHLPYTVNLAAPKPELHQFATDVLAEDLRRMKAIGAEFLAVHPGSHAGEGIEAGIERIAAAIEKALDGFTGPPMLLLETMAGQGSEVGGRPEEIASILERLGNPPGVGVCLDSCHLFAAGYDVRTPDGVQRLVEALDAAVGLRRVRAMHLNDSKTPLGSHRDRHELIGRGHIGRDGIMALLRNDFIKTLPLILETPVSDYLQYGEEIRAVSEIMGRAS